MPRGDGTGPYGEASWPCRRAVRGFSRGFGRGFRRFTYAEPTKEEERGYLNNEIKALETEIEAVKKKLGELK